MDAKVALIIAHVIDLRARTTTRVPLLLFVVNGLEVESLSLDSHAGTRCLRRGIHTSSLYILY
jgi:hypothetical protein